MTRTRLLSAIGIASALIAAACASDSDTKSRRGTGGGNGQGGSPDILFGTGGSGADGATGPLNPDGLAPLTPDQASQLTAAACEGWSAEPEKGPAVLEFVVDTTESMAQQAPSTGGRTKWAVMQEALPQALAQLPSTWALGLTFYCRNETGNCYQGREAVPIALLDANQQAALADAIQTRNTCQYTPSQAAWNFGLDTILNTTSANRYVVLVTDGVPTVNSDGCTLGSGSPSISQAEYDQFIATVASQTAGTGVKTFVVGVPGSEDPQGAPYDPMYELSLLAQAGGTAKAGCTAVSGTSNGTAVTPRGTYCHYDMTQTADFASGLLSTVGTIAGQVVSCTYTVPVSDDPNQTVVANKTNMVYDDGAGQMYLVQQNTASPCDVGWHFTDDTNQFIEICSTTCALLQANSQASIELTFGCVTNQIPT
jgi:hypothetical protein